MRRLVTLIVTLLACALPPAANAASVQRVGSILRYKAAAHEFIDGRVLATSGGAYLFRMRKGARQVLHARPGSGCHLDLPRELRCSGNGIERIEMRVGESRAAIFRIDG